MSEHEHAADAADRELARLREHSAEVGAEIKAARAAHVDADDLPNEGLQGAFGKDPQDGDPPPPEQSFPAPG